MIMGNGNERSYFSFFLLLARGAGSNYGSTERKYLRYNFITF